MIFGALILRAISLLGTEKDVPLTVTDAYSWFLLCCEIVPEGRYDQCNQ